MGYDVKAFLRSVVDVQAIAASEPFDRKLVEKYSIAMSESTRARRKQLGFANLQYIRHDRFFAILATKASPWPPWKQRGRSSLFV